MKKILISIMISLMILSTLPIIVQSQATIGVEVGDWFVYAVSVDQTVLSGGWTGSYLVPQNLRTSYYVYNTYAAAFRLNRTVTGVDDVTDTVNFTDISTNINGVVTTSDVTSNVSACDLYWRVIPSGLDTNDTLGITSPQPPGPIPASSTNFYINNTFSKTYDSGARTTCNLTLGPDIDYGDTRTVFNATYEWDQATGILAVANVSFHYTLSWGANTFEGITVFTHELLYSSVWGDIPNYDLDVVVSGQGSTDPAAGTYSYPDASFVTVNATANEGYKLGNWLLDDVDIGNANPYTVIMAADHNLTAVFVESPQVWLNISITGTGSVDPDVGSYQYELNSGAVAVTATDVLGWTFDHWVRNGTDVGSANPYYHTPDGNYTLDAVFVTVPVRELTVAVTGGGDVDPAVGTHQYNNGTVVAVTASDTIGWEFDHWTLNGTDVGSANPYTVTLNTSYTLTAVFTEDPQAWLTIVVDGTNVTTPAAGTHNYDVDTYAIVTATSSPATGWVFDHWLLDSANAGSDLSYNVTMDANHTLTAVFTEYPLTVAVSVDDWVTYTATYESTGNQSTQLTGNLNTTFTESYNWTTDTKTITAIDGLSINYTSARLHANGTLMNIAISEDITDNNNRFIIIADKEDTDWIISWLPYGPQYPQWGQTIILNETVMMDFNFVGGDREVNHADWLHSMFGNGEAWWDKESGILLRYAYNYTTGDGNESRTFLFDMEITNSSNSFFEIIPEYSNFSFTNVTVLLLMFVATIVSIDIFRRKKLTK